LPAYHVVPNKKVAGSAKKFARKGGTGAMAYMPRQVADVGEMFVKVKMSQRNRNSQTKRGKGGKK